jgi:hypothetical protein
MAALNFPNAPTSGQLFVAPSGVTYQFNGTLWVTYNNGQPGQVPSFFAPGVAGLSPAAALLPLQAPLFNIGNYFNPGTSRFTPPAGVYYIEASAGLGATGVAWNVVMQIRKNSVTTPILSSANNVGSGGSTGATVSGIVVANGTDYFEAWISSSAGQTLDATYTNFSASAISLFQQPAAAMVAAPFRQEITDPTASVTATVTFNASPMPITAGARMFFQSYTALNPANPVRVRMVAAFGSNAAHQIAVGLFIDGAATANRFTSCTPGASGYGTAIILDWQGVLSPGAHTFEVRGGTNDGGIFYLVSTNSSFFLPGAACIFSIEELGQGVQGPPGVQGSPGLGGPVAAANFSVSGGLVTINKSSNIASIIRQTSGSVGPWFTVNLTTPMADLFYRTSIGVQNSGATGPGSTPEYTQAGAAPRTLSQFSFGIFNNVGTAFIDPQTEAWFSVFP